MSWSNIAIHALKNNNTIPRLQIPLSSTAIYRHDEKTFGKCKYWTNTQDARANCCKAISLIFLLATIRASPLFVRTTDQVFVLGTDNNPANIQDGVGPGNDTYKMYSGNGSAAAGWPTKAQWVSFENMWVLKVAS